MLMKHQTNSLPGIRRTLRHTKSAPSIALSNELQVGCNFYKEGFYQLKGQIKTITKQTSSTPTLCEHNNDIYNMHKCTHIDVHKLLVVWIRSTP